MKNCLITGASGLIGRHLILKLNKDMQIFALSRCKNNPIFQDMANTRVIETDFSSPDWTPAILPDRIDCIIHLAQSEHFKEFPEKATDIFNVNTLSTVKLLDYAKKAGAKQFIYASSGGIKDNKQKDSELNFYLNSKLCSEIISENYKSFFNVIILRFFFVYGPGQKKNMLLPRLVHSIKTNQPIRLEGVNGLKLNPIHVNDATDIVTDLVKDNKGSQKIDIAGDEILSLKEVCEIIGKKVDKKPMFEIISHTISPDLVGNNKSTPLKVNFAEGIKDLI